MIYQLSPSPLALGMLSLDRDDLYLAFVSEHGLQMRLPVDMNCLLHFRQMRGLVGS
jgi:hypothetical protein